jgi:translation initiation factor IF-2
VLWVAEEQKLMAKTDRLAAGTVIEAHLDRKRGAVATLLVQVGKKPHFGFFPHLV